MALASLVRLLEQKNFRAELLPPRDPENLAFCHFSGLLGLAGIGAEPHEHVENVTVPLRAFTCYDQGAIDQVVALVNRFVTMSKDTNRLYGGDSRPVADVEL